MDNTPSVAARPLTKTCPGGVEAVKGISCGVAQGEVFGWETTIARMVS
jgi:hypothetical protein